jgi:lysophospholipase L1-like esterase
MRVGPLRATLLRATLIAAPLLVSFIVGECTLRLLAARERAAIRAQAYPGRELCTTGDPELLYTYRPNTCGANALGYLTPEFPRRKLPGRFRIALVGDSVAAGQYVSRCEAVGQVLQQNLNERGSGRFEVVTLARSGYSTAQELIVLERDGYSHDPDLVLVLYVLNDPAYPLYHGADGDLARYHYRPSSYVLGFVAERLFRLRDWWLGRGCPAEFHQRLHCAYRTRIERHFAELGRLAREHRRPTFVVIHPLLEDDFSRYAYEAIHHDLVRMARAAGLGAIDLLDAFRPCRGKLVSRPGDDPWHPNGLGHEIAARAIHRGLAQAGLAPPVTETRAPRVVASDPSSAWRRGWSEPSRRELQTVRANSAADAEVMMELTPAPGGNSLALGGRAADGAERCNIDLRINGRAAGRTVAGSWPTSRLAVPRELLLDGRNRIGLHFGESCPVPAVWLSELSFGSLREQVTLELDGEAVVDRRSTLSLVVSPTAGDYGVWIRASAAPGRPIVVGAELNQHRLGTIEIGQDGGDHEVLVPRAALQRGRNLLVLSLERQAAVRLQRVTLVPRHPSEVQVLPATAGAPQMSAGWYAPEPHGTSRITWSRGRESRVKVELAPTSDRYVFRSRAAAFSPVAPVSVQIEINGQAVGRLVADDGWSDHTRPIPAGVLRRGWNAIVLRYDKVGKPRPGDPRDQMAVCWEWIEIGRD